MNINLGQPEALEWCFIDKTKSEPSAPISLRDLEVLWETNAIDAQTFVWKQGMPEWKKIEDLPELSKRILEDTYVPFNPVAATKPISADNALLVDVPGSKEPQKVGNIIQSRKEEPAEPEDALDSLEKKFEKIKKNFYQGPDGLWYVNDPKTGQWKPQAEAPNIELFNEDLLEDLIFGIGDDDKEEDERKRQFRDAKKKGGKTAMVDLDTLTDEQIKKIEKNKKKAKKQAEKKKQKWYNSKVNAHLYAKGLPDDVTHDELKEFFSKAGVIRTDLQTGSEKIKIYRDEQDRPKGDALISYLRPESVDLAMEMLNETELRPGCKIHLDRAHFEQKGDYVPRKKVKEDKVTLIKNKTDQDRLLTWDEEDKGEGLKIVVITNMFSPEEVEAEENFADNLRQDVQEECEAKLGPVHKITVFEHNPLGPVQIKFKDDAAAEGCIKLMNNRFFAGKQLKCFYWDGVTDYKRIRETMEDEEKRINDFGKWIEQQGEDKGEDKQKTEK